MAGNPNMKRGKKSINPTGKKKTKRVDNARNDGWASALTGAGLGQHDRRINYDFVADTIDFKTAQDLWRGDDLAAKVIERPAMDMTRQGFDFQTEDDKSLAEDIEDEWKRLKVKATVRTGVEYNRAYGGCGIFLGTKDSALISEPLGVIRSLDFLTVFEPRELVPETWYSDPLSANYGEVRTYKLQALTSGAVNPSQIVEVHASRLLILDGIKVTKEDLNGNGFGDSVLTRINAVLRDFNMSWGSVATLLQDVSPAVLKMKDLSALLSDDRGAEKLKHRLNGIELSKATCRMILIDETEDYGRQATPLSGIEGLLEKFLTRMTAATGMPASILFGMSASGLNASDEFSMQIWYDTVASMQDVHAVPMLERITDILLGIRKSKAKYTIVPRPLWKPSEKVLAETRKLVAETDKIYLEMMVVFPEDIAISRFGGDTYSMETVVDLEERKRLELSAAEETKIINEAAAPSQGKSAEPRAKAKETKA